MNANLVELTKEVAKLEESMDKLIKNYIKEEEKIQTLQNVLIQITNIKEEMDFTQYITNIIK